MMSKQTCPKPAFASLNGSVKIPSHETTDVEEDVSRSSRPGSDFNILVSNIFKEFEAKTSNSCETLCIPDNEPENGSVIVLSFNLPGISIIR
jgi:hypothetical protein